MNSDAARSDAFTKYCISSNMSLDEVSLAAAVFAAAWDAGAEYGAERAEDERDAALTKVARLRYRARLVYEKCGGCDTNSDCYTEMEWLLEEIATSNVYSDERSSPDP